MVYLYSILYSSCLFGVTDVDKPSFNKKLTLNSSYPIPFDCSAVQDFLYVAMALSSLTLVNVELTPDSTKEIFVGFKKNNSLSELSFQQMPCLRDAGKEIVEFIKANEAVKSLDICSCELDDALVTEIANALKVNTAITRLCLRGNKFYSSGASQLCCVVKEKKVLLELDMSRNKVGFKEILPALEGSDGKNNIIFDLECLIEVYHIIPEQFCMITLDCEIRSQPVTGRPVRPSVLLRLPISACRIYTTVDLSLFSQQRLGFEALFQPKNEHSFA